MKKIHLIAALMLSIGLLSSGSALADHGHFRGSVGIYVGPGFGPGFGPGYGPYYPRPYYPYSYYDPYVYGYPYSPPVIVTPAPVVQSPPVYIEQQTQQQPAPTANQSSAPADYYWYHCDQPEGYYPYIKECPQGWTKVTPQPPK